MRCKDNHKEARDRTGQLRTVRGATTTEADPVRRKTGARESDRGTRAHANQHVCTRIHTTNHPRTHAHMTNGTGRSAGATPRRLTRRGRPAPTAAAVHGAEAGARRPGLPAPTTSTLDHTLTLPTRLPHIPDGKTGFEEWEAGEVGGSKKGPEGY